MKRSLDSRVDSSLILPVFCLLALESQLSIQQLVMTTQTMFGPYLDNNLFGYRQIVFFSFIVIFLTQVSAVHTLFIWTWSSLDGLAFGPLQPEFSSCNLKENWVSIGGYTLFQPSEFMKISYIPMLAYVIVTSTKKHKDKERTIGLDFLLILWMIVFTMPVMVYQPCKVTRTAMVCCNLAGLVFVGAFLEDYYSNFCKVVVGDYRLPSNLCLTKDMCLYAPN